MRPAGRARTGATGPPGDDVGIQLRGLRKTFRVPERDPGLRAATRSLFRRPTREVRAVDGLSFDIARGEVVGFLGPNGAGKTTTLKILSGLLHPTSGEVRVLGHEPARRRREFLTRISLVMGNRSQLQWDLPAEDSYELHRVIYQVPWPEYRRTRDELVELLDIGGLVRKPVRTLSLGERMKAELVLSLIHHPLVLFLDEPTIGLDVTMQKRIRTFVGDYSARHGASVLLTSHYMADVEALCDRVIVISSGRVVLDGALATIADRFASHKEVSVDLGQPADLSRFGAAVQSSGDRVRLRVRRHDVPDVVYQLLSQHRVLDISVVDPPIADVIEAAVSRQDT